MCHVALSPGICKTGPPHVDTCSPVVASVRLSPASAAALSGRSASMEQLSASHALSHTQRPPVQTPLRLQARSDVHAIDFCRVERVVGGAQHQTAERQMGISKYGV